MVDGRWSVKMGEPLDPPPVSSVVEVDENEAPVRSPMSSPVSRGSRVDPPGMGSLKSTLNGKRQRELADVANFGRGLEGGECLQWMLLFEKQAMGLELEGLTLGTFSLEVPKGSQVKSALRSASRLVTTSLPGREKGASMSLQLVNLAMKCVKESVHSLRTQRELSLIHI